MTSNVSLNIQQLLDPGASRPGRDIGLPAADEYDPYYGAYISLVPGGDLAQWMRRQAEELVGLLGSCSAEQAGFAYAPGKWTVTEVIGHLTDTERVFTYRATSIARGDAAALPGFSQDDWMEAKPFAGRTLASVLEEWCVVRAASIALIEGLPRGAEDRRGTASGRPFTARALLHASPGHTAYHLKHMREHYFASPNWPR